LPSTDFKYRSGSLVPVSGVIRHSGTVSFANGLTVGDFDIGFDASRAKGAASGFFVRNTVGALAGAVLFDVAAPSSVGATVNTLNIGRANLLVSPELAGVLGNTALTGAVVGAARIDGLSTPGIGQVLHVAGRSFNASAVRNLVINTGGGFDLVGLYQVDLVGNVTIDVGDGGNLVTVDQTAARNLSITSGAGRDSINIRNSVFVGSTVRTGAGSDQVVVRTSLFSGTMLFDGGAGFDLLVGVGSTPLRPAASNFEDAFDGPVFIRTF
jgi:hypothetical protein